MAAPGGYSLETSSSSSAYGQAQSAFDNAGFVVNFGGKGGVTTGAAPSWVWAALAAVAGIGLWLVARR